MPTRLQIGIAQTPNSTDIKSNFDSIMKLLERFEKTDVNVILFPECSLSGFSAQMRLSTIAVLQPHLDVVQAWSERTGIEVVLPTALVELNQIFDCGFWFKPLSVERFYKTVLTASEQKYFSVPAVATKEIFEIQGFRLAILICFEAEQPPWSHFQKGEVDAILWPSYWGWTEDETWTEARKDGPNPIFENMKEWKVPLLQANFAHNDLQGHRGPGPEGLSFVVGHDNTLVYRGPHLKADGFIVSLEKEGAQTVVKSCVTLTET